METLTIVVNTGSASKKYAIYQGGMCCATFYAERRNDSYVMAVTTDGETKEREISQEAYHHAFSLVITEARALGVNVTTTHTIVGVRVVAPGTFFTEHRVVDDTYHEKLRAAEAIAPLHIRPLLDELKSIEQELPRSPIVGVSDSAFHHTKPTYARLYGLPADRAQELDIYRFGYHGISAESAVRALTELLPELPRRTVICHLGGGSSVIALENGVSVDTSMGFTPLEGIIGGTRVGTVDAGAILHLATQTEPTTLLNELNTQSGLKGISGVTSDIRELIKREKEGDQNAQSALDLYVYQIQKHIGAFTAALGGIDVLVFTGTVGERSSIMRARICVSLNFLGITLNEERNDITIETIGEIGNGAVRIMVIPAREMGTIAEIAKNLTRNNL